MWFTRRMKSKIKPHLKNKPLKAGWVGDNVPIFEKKRSLERLENVTANSNVWSRSSSKQVRMGTYFNTMKYIFKALRLVGCLPMSIDDKSGTVKFRVLSSALAFTIFIYSAWSLLVWYVVEDRFRILANSTDSFDDSLMAYVFIIYFWEWPLVPFIRWFWQTPRLVSFLAKWRSFEEQYEKVTGVSMAMEQKMNRVIVVLIVFSIPWVSSLIMVLAHYIIPKMRPHHLASYWYIATEMYLNTALAWATSQALRSASQGLVQGIRRDSASGDSGTIPQRGGTRPWPQEYMELWRKLSIIVRNSGSGVIGPAFVLNMGKEFPNMLFAAYGIITWLEGGAKGKESGVVLILVHHFFDLIVLGNSAHMASNSAGSEFRDELSLMMVKPRTTKSVKKEIREFLQLMDATPPYISIGEYVTLNKEFVSQLMGTIVTYVVVLLQFRNGIHTPNIQPSILNGTNITSNELESVLFNGTETTVGSY